MIFCINCNYNLYYQVTFLSEEEQNQYENNLAELNQLKQDLKVQIPLAGFNARKIKVKVNPIKAAICELDIANQTLEFEASKIANDPVSHPSYII